MMGQCLCGAVRFSARPVDGQVVACHCGQCRKWSGHYWAAFLAGDLLIEDARHLRWFASSPNAQRGFCDNCGSSLFWRTDGRDEVAVSGGAMNMPTGLQMTGHIHVADKGDYYPMPDDLPELPVDDN